MKLIVEKPYREAKEYFWDEEIQKQFEIDSIDKEVLESGKVLWRGETALTLEDE
jgi:hypothetical protein